MSLNPQQQANTMKELNENFRLTGLTEDQVAKDLKTTPEYIDAILHLQPKKIEDPWILKNYLLAKLDEAGITPVPFTALVGDYHQYWFLNGKKIDRRQLA